MHTFEAAVRPQVEEAQGHQNAAGEVEVEARL
jgi:hypothetical protein